MLCAAAAYLGWLQLSLGGWTDLSYLTRGGRDLAGPLGLHLYSAHPHLQIGPLSLLAADIVSRVDPGHVRGAFEVFGLLTLTGLLALLAAEPAGAVVLGLAWADLVQGSGHLDDAIALLAVAAALRAVNRGSPWAAGVALAAGVAAKPIALFAVPLLLVLPGARDRLRGALAAGVGSALVFLPFELAAPGTLGRLAAVRITVHPGSLLHLVLPLTAQAPGWVRPAQFCLAIAGAALCLRRGRPEVVLLVVFVARLSLDAGDFPYYAPEALLGLLISLQARGAGWAVTLGAMSAAWISLDLDPFLLGVAHQDVQRLIALAALAVWAFCGPVAASGISPARRWQIRERNELSHARRPEPAVSG